MHANQFYTLWFSPKRGRSVLYALLLLGSASFFTARAFLSKKPTNADLPPLKLYTALRSPNHSARIRYLIIHYTSMNLEKTLACFSDRSSKVSAHFLIPAQPKKTWLRKQKKVLPILTLVPSFQRAWHAGCSSWNGQQRLNDNSIGIELENTTSGYRAPNQEEYFYYVDFSNRQIEALACLIKQLCQIYPQIRPTHILGHSDIAPGRKSDPGPRFPWEVLYRTYQIGAWFDADRFAYYLDQFVMQLPPPQQIQRLLQIYGYGIDSPQPYFDVQAERVLKAFQLHFVPYAVLGQVDPETCATIYALVEKYYPQAFALAIAES